MSAQGECKVGTCIMRKYIKLNTNRVELQLVGHRFVMFQVLISCNGIGWFVLHELGSRFIKISNHFEMYPKLITRGIRVC